jgi:hypothetical protein
MEINVAVIEFLNFLRILNRFEVGVFARAVKLESPCICSSNRFPTMVRR